MPEAACLQRSGRKGWLQRWQVLRQRHSEVGWLDVNPQPRDPQSKISRTQRTRNCGAGRTRLRRSVGMCPILEPRHGSRRSAEVHSPPRRHARSPPHRHREAPTRQRARRAKTAKTGSRRRVTVRWRRSLFAPPVSRSNHTEKPLPLPRPAQGQGRTTLSHRARERATQPALSLSKAAVRSARVPLRAWPIYSLEFNEEGSG